MANTVWNFNFWPQNHTGPIAFPRISQHNHITGKVCHSDKERKRENYIKKRRRSLRNEKWNWSLEEQRKVRVKQSERERNASHTNHQADFYRDKLICRQINKSLSHSKQNCTRTRWAKRQRSKHKYIRKHIHTHTGSVRTHTVIYTHPHKVTKLRVWDIEWLGELFQTSVLMWWNNFTPLKSAEQLRPN